MREIKDLSVIAYSDINCVVFDWAANIGFGQLILQRDINGDWKADTECMCKGEDKEFIRKLLNTWVDEIEVIG